jgi:very-short-patch-repair endonuclease
MHRKNPRIAYDPALKQLARKLRKHGTMGEALLWRQLSRRALGCEFHRQVPLDAFIVDFYCHELKLVVEIDGSSHDQPANSDADLQRQARLESLGVSFLRFTEFEVRRDAVRVAQQIKA